MPKKNVSTDVDIEREMYTYREREHTKGENMERRMEEEEEI